jgi:hypothetical protein
MMQVKVLDFTNIDKYDEAFENSSSAFIQQSTYWAKAIKPLRDYSLRFLACEDDDGKVLGGLPLYIFQRELAFGRYWGSVINSVPEAGPLGGVFCRDGLSPETIWSVYDNLLYKAMGIAADLSVLTMTIITNPFDSNFCLYDRELHPEYVFHNFTQYIELDEIFRDGQLFLPNAKRRHAVNRYVKKASEAGVYVEKCRCHDDFNFWYDVHKKRHKEIGVRPLNLELLWNLLTELVIGRNKGQLYLTVYRSRVIGGLFVVKHKEIADAFMISFDSEYKDLVPNYLCVHRALKDLYKQGVKIFNWQSSQNRSCGVYEFKKGWGSKEASYQFVTKLISDSALSHIEMLGLDDLKRSYPGNYVVPFGIFEKGFNVKEFYKGE